ncbi:hypothetical protein BSR29_06225 [Boudabousia liubingyangii]|uniref:Aldose 1-epimerase n=1 Tax=Boudabousia liubingyangii TaxID=1921764 RepID=A0A1Q5PKP5_9ACTO|nr:hypothetical protein [Boudabousia liubingyangii]OKL47213.1 hypothetical protein BSR29_06225 [Boudabousia liubingyangii]
MSSTDLELPQNLELKKGPFSAQVILNGALLNRLTKETENGPVEVISGYADRSEWEILDGYRGAILAPWSNRIEDARYTFDGKEYDLGEREPGLRDGLHGLVYNQDFTVVEQEPHRVLLETKVTAGSSYPGDLVVQVSYELTEQGVITQVSAYNPGEKELPVGLGWHPYFKHTGSYRLSFDAQARVQADENLIPLPGAAAYEPTGGVVELDVTEGIDTPFTDLLRPVAKLETEEYQLTMHYRGVLNGPGVGIFHVYTGDFLENRPNLSLALEPCEFVTNAFNREECKEMSLLAPGETRVLEAELVID